MTEENRSILVPEMYEVCTQQSRYAATSVARKELSRFGNENAIILCASAQMLAIVCNVGAPMVFSLYAASTCTLLAFRNRSSVQKAHLLSPSRLRVELQMWAVCLVLVH